MSWFGVDLVSFQRATACPARMVWLHRNTRKCLVKMPADDEIAACKRIVVDRHDALLDVCCFADGLKLQFEKCDEMDKQSMFHNGWKSGHFIANLFVFAIDGRIVNCVINAPGPVHDSTLVEWGAVHTNLQESYERTGGKCCVVSAFATTENPFLLKSATNCNQ